MLRSLCPGLHPATAFRSVCALLCALYSLSPAAASPGLAATSEPQSPGGPATVRRLTEAQYRATIADVFSPEIQIVGRFERALRADGLIAIGTSEAGLSTFAIEQYDASARVIAAAATSEALRATLLPCSPQDAGSFDAACAERIVASYGLRLFRRPLTSGEATLFLDAARNAFDQLGNFYESLEYTLSGMLVSPQFLLRIEATEAVPGRPGTVRLDDWSRAARLSFFLTGSTPDDQLLAATAAGELDSPAGLAAQVDRLMASERFPGAVEAFFADMLQFELFDDLAKDPVIYPAYNSTVAADAQAQTLRTITQHLLQEHGDYRDLFTTRLAPLTRSLGTVYRMPVATRNGWELKEFSERSGRAGIQSQLAFLALHSHPGRSSPTLRGKAIREVFLCQHVPDPPVDVDFSGFDDTSNLQRPTARDRLEAHRTQPACKACHTLMDPLGLTLERFDGAGGFRSRENGALIDVSGALDGRNFEAAPGLGEALREHPEVPRCLVSKLYRSGVGRDTVAGESPFMQYLNDYFAAQGYRLPELMRAIANSEAFYAVTAEQDGPAVADSRHDDGGRS